MARYDHLGEPLGCLNVETLDHLMGDYPSLAILRRDLMTVLEQAALDAGVDIQFESTVNIERDERSLNPHISVNGVSYKSEMILGCDGRMNSTARKYVVGDNTPVFRNFMNWVGIVTFPSSVFDTFHVQDYWGVGHRFGIVPVDANTAYWAAGSYREVPPTKNESLGIQQITDMFVGWPKQVTNVLAHANESEFREIAVYDHDPSSIWHRDNVLLMGDAAHAALPTSGQGACQALEDAWHLSELVKQGNGIDETAREFTKIRMGKTTGITMAARGLASNLFSTDELFCKQRNQQSKATDYEKTVAGMAQFWSAGLESLTKINF
jgi:2-polyprenyl-6-methoxyphenol hydroxylase-like FAD-dependent oxidoreductase